VQILKKISFYLFLALSLACAIWGYFKLKESKEPNSNVLEHISNKTFCLIETSTYSDLINQLVRQNLIWNSLSEDQHLKKAQDNTAYFDSLVTEHSELKTILENNKLFLSCYNQNSNTNYLIQFKLKEASDETFLNSFFKTNLTQDNSSSSITYYHKTVHGQKWLIYLKDGIVYITNDLATLETSVNLKKEESLAQSLIYLNLLKTNGKQKTSVFINNKLMPIFNDDVLNTPSIFTTDFNLNHISLSGYSQIDSTTLFNALKNQKPQTLDFYDELPDNPISFSAVALSEPKLFYSNLHFEMNSEKWKNLNDSALYDIKTEFLNTIETGIITSNYQVNQSIQSLTLLKTNDSEKSKSLFELISDSAFVIGDISTYRIKTNYTTLFSWLDKGIKNNYVSINKKTIVFSSNRDILNNFINSLNTSNTISKNTVFMNYASNNLLADCNYMYYENVEFLKTNKQKSIININQLNLKESPYTHLSFIANHSKNVMQVRINLIKENNKQDNLNTSSYLWAYSADSIINNSLNVFTNHTTQENEITFQDNSNSLYLISSTGNLIWKKKLSEPIKSKIYTVDIFRNGKLQLLFNTKNHIHLIDRNGKYIQGYPLKTPNSITSNITLLDYDNTKDYRIFIACADKKIYNFSLYGIKTEGFVPFKTADIVELPISYVKIGLSDYLITADISGKIYAFSRKGLGRIDFKNKTIQDLNHLLVLEGTNIENTKLIYVDDKNNLLSKISLTDKKEIIKIGDELNGFKTSFHLINDDNQKDLLCYGNGAFYGYDLFSNKLIEYFNENAVYTNVECVKLTNKLLYVAFDNAEQKTDILNTNGKLIKQFPNTTHKPLIVDLYKNGKQYVLMINNNKVNCVELN
jgi:hypothetical protein